jgi:hypothetical protein
MWFGFINNKLAMQSPWLAGGYFATAEASPVVVSITRYIGASFANSLFCDENGTLCLSIAS